MFNSFYPTIIPFLPILRLLYLLDPTHEQNFISASSEPPLSLNAYQGVSICSSFIDNESSRLTYDAAIYLSVCVRFD